MVTTIGLIREVSIIQDTTHLALRATETIDKVLT